MYKIVFVIFLSALCSISFASGVKFNPKPIIEYGEHLGDDFIFQKLTAITITEDGFIWAVDRDANRIFKFDFDGNVLAKIGEKGQGPGEFFSPADIEQVGKQIWVADHRNGRIQVFEDDAYKKTIRLDNPTSPKSFLKIEDTIYVSGLFYLDQVSNIAKLDFYGNLIGIIDTISVPEAPSKKTAGMWRIFELINIRDELTLGFIFDSLVVKASTTGETRLVKDMTDYYKAEKSPASPLNAPRSMLVSSFATGPDDTILISICDHEVERNDCSIIYQFDANLRTILNRWDIGESVRAMHYDASKGLLAVVTAELIRVYELASE
jgi:hypothetical protein